MSDEAFARRFYSDRAELLALGVPLQSQRDEFTGEELYTLRSENYFLPQARARRRRARGAPDRALPARGQVRIRRAAAARAPEPRARPPGLRRARRPRRRCASRCSTRTTRRDARPARQARGRDLEAAHDQVPLLVDLARRGEPSARSTRTRCSPTTAPGTSSARISTASDIRTFRVSRIRGDIRFATRRERDFRIPADFDIDQYRGRPPWQIGDIVGEARIEVAADTAWWVERAYGERGPARRRRLRHRLLVAAQLASWVLRQDGRAIPLEPDELRREVAAACASVRERHEEAAAEAGRTPRLPSRAEAAGERPAGPVAPERFARPPGAARLPARRLRRGHDAVIPAAELVERFHIPADELEEHLSLLNLVNFGGGCYTVYAELDGDERARRQGALRRHVPARAAPDAARGARDPPRARVRRPDDRRRCAHAARPRPQEARGDVRPVRARADAGAAGRRGGGRPRRDAHRGRSASAGSSRSSTRRKASTTCRHASSSRTRSSASCPNWYVHTWDRTRDGERSFRLDRMRSAHADEGELRAARGLRAAPAPRRAHARDPLREGRRALGGRARRAAARRTAPRSPSCRSAARSGSIGEILSLARRGGRARAGGPARARSRPARASSQELGVSRLRARA